MDTRERMAEIELMEKLATLEADEPEVEAFQKTASVSGLDRSSFLRKVASIMAASRRAGQARAEAEFARGAYSSCTQK